MSSSGLLEPLRTKLNIFSIKFRKADFHSQRAIGVGMIGNVNIELIHGKDHLVAVS